MALSATIYAFDINLADVDRSVYETLSLKVAMHPSESMEYMLLRLLAYCLEYREGITFGKGIGQDDEAPVYAKDLTGQLTLWVEIGLPSPDKMHRASKAAPSVALYTHRDAPILWRNFEGATIHRAADIPLYVVEPRFLRVWGEKIDRRNTMDLSVTERQIFLSIGGETLETSLPALTLQRPAIG
jgi:uncharacterized protein YaeQ